MFHKTYEIAYIGPSRNRSAGPGAEDYLRLAGPFATREQAEARLPMLRARFPKASIWIRRNEEQLPPAFNGSSRARGWG